MTSDIRWIQRFNNYLRAYDLLKEAAFIGEPSELEIEGMIQRFEYTFELAWKTMKDYLEEMGFTEIVGSREAIRIAFANGIIADGDIWMEMIKARNLTTHIYNSETAHQIWSDIIKLYLPCFKQFRDYLEGKLT
jgi:nucleotidyltransferase substrate binding protein (TIGR01987 family)